VKLEGGAEAGGNAEYVTGRITSTPITRRRSRIPRGVVTLRKLDGLDRVIEETVDTDGLGATAALALTTKIEYDGLGNKTMVRQFEGQPEDRATLLRVRRARASHEDDGRRGEGKQCDVLRRWAEGERDGPAWGSPSSSPTTTSAASGRARWRRRFLSRTSPGATRRFTSTGRIRGGSRRTRAEDDHLRPRRPGAYHQETDARRGLPDLHWDGVNKREETDKRHHVTAFEYDGVNRLVKTTDPAPFGTQTAVVSYDDTHNRVTEKDRRGNRK